MKYLDDLLLDRDITKHTNSVKENYLNICNFPEQIKELINTNITIKYRDHYKNSISNKENPSDSPDKIHSDRYQTNTFRIVRADALFPYILIAISKDYTRIIISNTEKKINDNQEVDYNFLTNIEIYPIQFNEFIPLYGRTYYPIDKYNPAYLLRVDNGEPCHSVIMEVMNTETNEVRFRLGQECDMVIDGYLDLDMNIHSIENWKNYNYSINDKDIAKYREKLLEGIVIYGTLQS